MDFPRLAVPPNFLFTLGVLVVVILKSIPLAEPISGTAPLHALGRIDFRRGHIGRTIGAWSRLPVRLAIPVPNSSPPGDLEGMVRTFVIILVRKVEKMVKVLHGYILAIWYGRLTARAPATDTRPWRIRPARVQPDPCLPDVSSSWKDSAPAHPPCRRRPAASDPAAVTVAGPMSNRLTWLCSAEPVTSDRATGGFTSVDACWAAARR